MKIRVEAMSIQVVELDYDGDVNDRDALRAVVEKIDWGPVQHEWCDTIVSADGIGELLQIK